MPTSKNLTSLVDINMWEIVDVGPSNVASGVMTATDLRGTHPYIYVIYGPTAVYRYSTTYNSWQRLANHVGASLNAAAAAFDPTYGTSGGIWLVNRDGSAVLTLQVYDVALNTWTSKSVSGLTTTFTTDMALVHTCSQYSASYNDDYLYYICGGQSSLYRYSISGNIWTAMSATIPAQTLGGVSIHGVPAWDPDKLVVIRGNATNTYYTYSISGNTWATPTSTIPETFTTGTQAVLRWGTSQIFIQHNSIGQISTLDLSTGAYAGQSTVYGITNGSALSGNRLAYQRDASSGIEFVYLSSGGTANWARNLIL